MSDREARELERRAQTDRTPENLAASLRSKLLSQDKNCAYCQGVGCLCHRQRPAGQICRTAACLVCAGTGATIRPRVELAAYCAVVHAREAIRDLGCPAYCSRPTTPGLGHQPDDRCCEDVPESFSDWIAGLEPYLQIDWPPPHLLFCMLATKVAKVADLTWSQRFANDEAAPGMHEQTFIEYLHGPRLAIKAAELWLECPCRDHWEELANRCTNQAHPAFTYVWWSNLAFLADPHAWARRQSPDYEGGVYPLAGLVRAGETAAPYIHRGVVGVLELMQYHLGEWALT